MCSCVAMRKKNHAAYKYDLKHVLNIPNMKKNRMLSGRPYLQNAKKCMHYSVRARNNTPQNNDCFGNMAMTKWT